MRHLQSSAFAANILKLKVISGPSINKKQTTTNNIPANQSASILFKC